MSPELISFITIVSEATMGYLEASSLVGFRIRGREGCCSTRITLLSILKCTYIAENFCRRSSCILYQFAYLLSKLCAISVFLCFGTFFLQWRIIFAVFFSGASPKALVGTSSNVSEVYLWHSIRELWPLKAAETGSILRGTIFSGKTGKGVGVEV